MAPATGSPTTVTLTTWIEPLLLIPPDDQSWPVEETFRLGVRWLATFRATPHVADRAIMFIRRTLGLRNDAAITLVLDVLGDDVRSILRESRYAIAWLQIVLSNPLEGASTAPAGALLDRLAASGDNGAIEVQQALEA